MQITAVKHEIAKWNIHIENTHKNKITKETWIPIKFNLN